MGLRQEVVQELDVYRGFITLIFNSVGEEHPFAPVAPTNQFQQKFIDSLKSINFDYNYVFNSGNDGISDNELIALDKSDNKWFLKNLLKFSRHAMAGARKASHGAKSGAIAISNHLVDYKSAVLLYS